MTPEARYAAFEEAIADAGRREAAEHEQARVRAILSPDAIRLPGGFVWHLLPVPDAARYARWEHLLRTEAAPAETWAALFAAYDAGWDVRGADGQVVPSPQWLSVEQYNRVPRLVIEAMVDAVIRTMRPVLQEQAQEVAA